MSFLNELWEKVIKVAFTDIQRALFMKAQHGFNINDSVIIHKNRLNLQKAFYMRCTQK